MSTYYRESFEYPPIRMFFDTNGADTVTINDNVGFTLNQPIQLPTNVVGYVSLQELTIANRNYNIKDILSYNINPEIYWKNKTNMVALNFQTFDNNLFKNYVMFKNNSFVHFSEINFD